MDRLTSIFKNKNGQMQLTEVKKILNKRKEEFINLLRMYQKKSGLPFSFDENCVVPIDDFKSCLKAFSIKVADKVSDLKR